MTPDGWSQIDVRHCPVPAVAGGIVSRCRLFERLDGAARVTQVSALAGSGKTFLVRSWLFESGRLPEPTEFAAYYTVAEALTNTAKHARASAAEVEVAAAEGMLRVRIRDDGVGGADFGRGTGLADLKDRIESLGGQVVLDSPRGAGTSLCAELPLTVTDSCAVPCDKGGQDDR
jgi:signal transduction histidine kinase